MWKNDIFFSLLSAHCCQLLGSLCPSQATYVPYRLTIELTISAQSDTASSQRPGVLSTPAPLPAFRAVVSGHGLWSGT